MKFQKPAFKALILWAAATLVVVAVSFWLNEKGLIGRLLRPGPYSIVGQTLAAVSVVWLLFGLTVFLFYFGKLNQENAPIYAGFLLVSLLYANLLRERVEYGDLEYYLDAATQLYKNRPLPNGYLYPPFWAAVLEPFVRYGKSGVLLVSWLLNMASVMAFYFLLIAALRRYQFSPRLAALTATFFALVNVPALRTLYYGQVNLHMVNCILLALALYPRRRFLSALALATAVHLKISPLILAFVFLLERDWRWLAWFVISLLLVGAFPVLMDGVSPYYDFLRNSQEVVGVRDINFREGSIDAVFLALFNLKQISLFTARAAAYLVKALTLGFAFLTLFRSVRNRTFYDGEGQIALNALPVMLLILNLASPLVWEHHGVFVALPFLLLLKKLETEADWLVFAFAYAAQFLIPTFDYYPWSTVLRLSAPLLALWLIYRVSNTLKSSPAFEKANLRLQSL